MQAVTFRILERRSVSLRNEIPPENMSGSAAGPSPQFKAGCRCVRQFRDSQLSGHSITGKFGMPMSKMLFHFDDAPGQA